MCKNPLENFSSRFFGSRLHSPQILSSKVQTINADHYSSLLVQLKDILKEKLCGNFTEESSSCTIMPRLTGYLQPRRNWTAWASNILITHYIPGIWPRQNTSCSFDWKSNWNVSFFRPTRRSFLSRIPGWTDKLFIFYLVACKRQSHGLRCVLTSWEVWWKYPK